MRLFSSTLILVLVLFSAQAQTLSGLNRQSTLAISKTKDYSKIPNYIKFDGAEKITINELDNWLNKFYESTGFELELIDSKADDLGFKHYRYQQTINGSSIVLISRINRMLINVLFASNSNS